MPEERFAVWQFFPDDWHECVGRDLGAEEAVKLAKRMTETLGARMGTTRRVIITDDLDCTCFQWEFGKGVTYPTREMRDGADHQALGDRPAEGDEVDARPADAGAPGHGPGPG